MRRAGMTVAVAALALVATGVAGCGSSSSSNSSGGSSTSSGTSTSAAAGAAAGGGETLRTSADANGGLAFVKKSLTAKAGKVTMVMANPSSSGLQHGIAVEGNGVDKDGAIVGPGKTSTVTVTLKPGKYEFYCPFGGHKAAGMTGTLTVK